VKFHYAECNVVPLISLNKQLNLHQSLTTIIIMMYLLRTVPPALTHYSQTHTVDTVWKVSNFRCTRQFRSSEMWRPAVRA